MTAPAFLSKPRIAVMAPCLNEEAAIGKVVADFRRELPDATIYVFDNRSDDRTREVAAEAGAVVHKVYKRGKGNVVRRMFREVDADIYIMIDGDATYDAPSVHKLLEVFESERADMVCGARVSEEEAAYRFGHRFGNRMLTGLVASVFGADLRDMLTGYRVMSRPFVKSFPALSQGFEIETELTIHAMELDLKVIEVDTPYVERPAGSESKLHTIRDGIRILRTIQWLVRAERPLQFFSTLAAIFAAASVIVGIPVLLEFLETGLVPRLPTAIASMGLMMTGLLSLFTGLILAMVAMARKEMRSLAYLGVPRFGEATATGRDA
ncbi:glycosyltransferase family 2 protein [Pseudokordiimonas caeni]|uniref:glycosyltransferase family 2 protein n=1 Tax=Pseudokordiimonas caeni TaxID=2997908 RepID=UPI002812231B|nr:glycosyltransferase family 2 protein [Pseudokordiimonas caeni]